MDDATNDKQDHKEFVAETTQETEGTLATEPMDSHQSGVLREIQASLNHQTNLLQNVKEMIHDRLEYDAGKEKAFDKLYEEMRRQREQSDALDRSVRPLFLDLLLLYDSMKRFDSWLTKQEGFDHEPVRSQFNYLEDELTEVLYRQDVVPMDDSDAFNAKMHKAIKTENAETQEQDFQILSVARTGFFWRDKVLRPQEVIIRRFSGNK